MNVKKYFSQNPNRAVQLFLTLWFVLNLFQSLFMELSSDEAYYWFVCRTLEWGFFDHPPMVSLLTFLGIHLFGDTEIGVRFFHVLLQPLYLYLLWTLVRRAKPSLHSAWAFCLICFSIPLLQLYGFVATPDAALMMSTMLTLWCFKRFTDTVTPKSSGVRFLDMILLGFAFALMGYSKYHGALVFLLLICSRTQLLGQLRFWGACLWALILFLPHLLWQWNHDWVSVAYHLVDRNSDFQWWNVIEYLLNVLGTFNPFLFPIFFVILVTLVARRRGKKRSATDNAMLWLSGGFLLFFLFSTSRGHVQPQWLIPVVFPMVYFIVRHLEHHPKLWLYVRNTSLFIGSLFIIVRIVIMTPIAENIKLDIFGNKATYLAIDSTLQGRKIVLAGHYAMGAEIDYYTRDTTRAFARPSIHSRNHQWGLLNTDQNWYGLKVAQELSDDVQRQIQRGELPTHNFLFFTHKGSKIYYDTLDFYIPTQRVAIDVETLPDKILIGQIMGLNLTITNPYDFDIPLGKKGFQLIMQLRQGRFLYHDWEVPISHTVLPAHSVTRIAATTKSPVMDTGEYLLGFSLRQYPFDSWYNSKRTKIKIVNPKSRI